MNRDDIIRMAKEARYELATKDYPGCFGQLDPWTMKLLERFAPLVAAAEREACAKVCEQIDTNAFGKERPAPNDCANAIRARGNK